MARMALITSLSIVLLVGAFDYVTANFCDIFDGDQCISLSTNMVCGTPTITQEQLQEINANRDIIEQITGPIYEGTPEALALGLSVFDPLVDLTFSQLNYLRRCRSELLPVFTEGRRKKRQAGSNACCAPSPETASLIASIATDTGNVVQVLQTGMFRYQDTRMCPASTNCAGVICGPIRASIPADVIIVDSIPPSVGLANIEVDVCGAITTG